MECREDLVFEALLKCDQISEKRRQQGRFRFLVRVLILLNFKYAPDYILAPSARLSV